MAHYKCGACRARLQVSGQPAERVGDLCPECGSLLEPVVEIAELLGFRRIGPVTAQLMPRGPRRTSGSQIASMGSLRERQLERDHVDAECWLDEDDSSRAAAVALPAPRTC